MSQDPIEELLRGADDTAPKLALRAPRLADLEHRRRMLLARRGGALLLLALVFASAMWGTDLRNRAIDDPGFAAAERLSRSLAELDGALDSLRIDDAPVASTTSEDAAMTTFHALHRGADRGDEQSIEGLRWLAERYSSTRGGRCARLFLNDRSL